MAQPKQGSGSSNETLKRVGTIVAVLTIIFIFAYRRQGRLNAELKEDGYFEAMGAKPPSNIASSGSLKTFEEGGTLTLDLAGQPATVKLTQVLYLNADSDSDDCVEVSAEATNLLIKNPDGMKEGKDGLSDYATIAGKPLPIQPKDLRDQASKITIPGFGAFPVLGGTLTLEKFEHGMNGRDWWDGKIELNLQTASGPNTAKGTFSTCIIPVW